MLTVRIILTVVLWGSITNSAIAQVPASLWDGIYSEVQAERGAVAYGARCASCHAVDLRGNSNSPSLLGMSFLFLWEGRSVGELYTKMRSEMPSDQPGSLPPQTYMDILTYILRANQYPAGMQELVADEQLLNRLLITGKPAR